MNIYITRHGETDWNSLWKLQGRSDTELNDKGKEQAALTHQGFIKAGIDFDRVYSSPLKRAFQTALLMSGKRENEIIIDDRLIEFCFGDAEGKTPDERNNNPELADFHLFFDQPELYKAKNNAESFESALKRTADFLEKEIKPLENNPDINNILIVTHGGCMQSLLLNIDGRPLKDFWKVKMPNCTVNKAVLQNGVFTMEYTAKTFYDTPDIADVANGYTSKK